MTKTTILLVHPIDPRGMKIGGIETHVRQLLRFCPPDVRVILIGLDDKGDLELGRVNKVRFQGRDIEIFPVLRYPEKDINQAAKSIGSSLTFNFLLAMFRFAGPIRRLARETGATADLQRVEFAWFARLLGIRYSIMLHGEGSPNQSMDSLLKRYWVVQRLNERVAVHGAERIFCVTDTRTAAVTASYPEVRDRTSTMTVSYDDTIFRPRPFAALDGPCKVLFVGRLDLFKRPALMFRVMAGLMARLGGQAEFHYVGLSDPEAFPDFAAIRDRAVLHGFRTSEQVGEVIAACHVGLLCSEFEGTPVFVLELIGSGRPLVTVRLPQLSAFVADGVSGTMIEANAEDAETGRLLVDAIERVWGEIRAGRIDPERAAPRVASLAVSRHLDRLFEAHRQIQSRGVAASTALQEQVR
jgi:glycosyltransferase involved in cell wall biosynthesis